MSCLIQKAHGFSDLKAIRKANDSCKLEADRCVTEEAVEFLCLLKMLSLPPLIGSVFRATILQRDFEFPTDLAYFSASIISNGGENHNQAA